MQIDNDHILTIAIPSYKRVEELGRLLDKLSREKSRSFEVLICDDDDQTDNVATLVQSYKKYIPHLRYHHNVTNLGFSKNVVQLYTLAKTPYIWYICDDDLILPGAVNKVVETIKRTRPSVALFNCTWIDPYGRESVAGVKSEITYSSRDSFQSYEVLERLTFLSIVVFERSLNHHELDIPDLDKHVFAQLYIAALLLTKRFCLVESPHLVVSRNVGYKYGEFYKFNITDHIRAFSSVPHCFDIQKIISLTSHRFIPLLTLYLSQKIGLYEYRIKNPTMETRLLMKNYYGRLLSSLFHTFPYIYRLTPAICIKITYAIILIRIHGLSKAMQIYSLNMNRAFIDKRVTKFTTYQ